MADAVNCACGSSNLEWRFDKDDLAVFVLCCMCHQTGPSAETYPMATYAWNKQQEEEQHGILSG